MHWSASATFGFAAVPNIFHVSWLADQIQIRPEVGRVISAL